MFGLTTLFLSARIGKSVYVIFTPREEREILYIQIGLSACFLIGVSLFYYVKSSIENKKTFPKSWLVHMASFLVAIIIVGIIKPYEVYPEFWNKFFVWFIYTVWGVYLFAAGFILRNVLQKCISKTSSCTTEEHWLIAIWISNVLIFIAYLIGYFYLYLVGTITFSVVFYGLLIFFLFKKNREAIFKEVPEKYGTKRIENREAEELLSQLKHLMEEKELYKETDIKLQKLASQIHISTHKLSQLLNDNLGKSFASFINDYRIEESKRLLKENHNLTLEAIGFEAGFSSKSSFYGTFKKVVGKTPSEFQKEFL